MIQSLTMAQELSNGLTGVIADLVELRQDEQYQQLMEILETDPRFTGQFYLISG